MAEWDVAFCRIGGLCPRKTHRRPSQRGGRARCRCLEAGARAQRQRRHACAHARRRVGPPNPPREDRLVLPAKSGFGSQEAPSAGGVHGGDGSEAGGKPERLHPLCRSRGVEAVQGRVNQVAQPAGSSEDARGGGLRNDPGRQRGPSGVRPARQHRAGTEPRGRTRGTRRGTRAVPARGGVPLSAGPRRDPASPGFAPGGDAVGGPDAAGGRRGGAGSAYAQKPRRRFRGGRKAPHCPGGTRVSAAAFGRGVARPPGRGAGGAQTGHSGRDTLAGEPGRLFSRQMKAPDPLPRPSLENQIQGTWAEPPGPQPAGDRDPPAQKGAPRAWVEGRRRAGGCGRQGLGPRVAVSGPTEARPQGGAAGREAFPSELGISKSKSGSPARRKARGSLQPHSGQSHWLPSMVITSKRGNSWAGSHHRSPFMHHLQGIAGASCHDADTSGAAARPAPARARSPRAAARSAARSSIGGAAAGRAENKGSRLEEARSDAPYWGACAWNAAQVGVAREAGSGGGWGTGRDDTTRPTSAPSRASSSALTLLSFQISNSPRRPLLGKGVGNGHCQGMRVRDEGGAACWIELASAAASSLLLRKEALRPQQPLVPNLTFPASGSELAGAENAAGGRGNRPSPSPHAPPAPLPAPAPAPPVPAGVLAPEPRVPGRGKGSGAAGGLRRAPPARGSVATGAALAAIFCSCRGRGSADAGRAGPLRVASARDPTLSPPSCTRAGAFPKPSRRRQSPARVHRGPLQPTGRGGLGAPGYPPPTPAFAPPRSAGGGAAGSPPQGGSACDGHSPGPRRLGPGPPFTPVAGLDPSPRRSPPRLREAGDSPRARQ
ncbi:collagen alpha-1(I) chain-like [Hyaena hyaena]|uniref:collagen alpha-1(I) chain-like n=1 Tax=Hyaena hyaena TaxID=95912 RepID=UPI0019240F26|nr:collagen alpha-1(I) chain-like [Hyaena hyaena]